MTERAGLPEDGDVTASADLAQQLLDIQRGEGASPERDKAALEARIRESEEALGIRTIPDRLIEAALLVDKKFLDFAIITEQTGSIERMFGDEVWAEFLEAHLFLTEHPNEPLTPRFVLALQKILGQRLLPDEAGKIVNSERSLETRPLSSEVWLQNEAVANNPLIKFVPDRDMSEVGYLHYVTITAEDRQAGLDTICQWYNDTKTYPDHDPYALAATLQHRLISWHSFRGGNGRTSRLLMNWSLASEGQSPSILDNFDDLLSTEEEWTEKVREGSERYAEIKSRAAAGETNPTTLFGLEQEQSRYEKYGATSGQVPPPLVGAEWYDHAQYEKFLAELRILV